MNHDWEQVSTCMNGPHLWQCKKCKEWTRSYEIPDPNASLIDPENHEVYSFSPTKCEAKSEH